MRKKKKEERERKEKEKLAKLPQKRDLMPTTEKVARQTRNAEKAAQDATQYFIKDRGSKRVRGNAIHETILTYCSTYFSVITASKNTDRKLTLARQDSELRVVVMLYQ